MPLICNADCSRAIPAAPGPSLDQWLRGGLEITHRTSRFGGIAGPAAASTRPALHKLEESI